MRMLRVSVLTLSLSLISTAVLAGAAEVVACRKLPDPAARFACYEKTVEDLERDLASEKKSGIDLFGLFSSKATRQDDLGKPEATRTQGVPEVSNMTDKLAAIGTAGGKPVFYFENGQVWQAQEYRRVNFKGDGTDRATVHKSVMGFLIEVNESGIEISVARIR